jgi:hypothetical protein
MRTVGNLRQSTGFWALHLPEAPQDCLLLLRWLLCRCPETLRPAPARGTLRVQDAGHRVHCS